MSNSFPATEESVKKATGKSWNEWVQLLDSKNASNMIHKDIVSLLLNEKLIASPWWCQMVTNGYERAKGKREAYSSTEGYQVSIGKTYSMNVDTLFDQFKEFLEKDLSKKVTITKF